MLKRKDRPSLNRLKILTERKKVLEFDLQNLRIQKEEIKNIKRLKSFTNRESHSFVPDSDCLLSQYLKGCPPIDRLDEHMEIFQLLQVLLIEHGLLSDDDNVYYPALSWESICIRMNSDLLGFGANNPFLHTRTAASYEMESNDLDSTYLLVWGVMEVLLNIDVRRFSLTEYEVNPNMRAGVTHFLILRSILLQLSYLRLDRNVLGKIKFFNSGPFRS